MLSISQRDNKGILSKMNNIRRDLKRKPLYIVKLDLNYDYFLQGSFGNCQIWREHIFHWWRWNWEEFSYQVEIIVVKFIQLRDHPQTT